MYKSMEIKDDWQAMFLINAVTCSFLFFGVSSTFFGQRLIDHSSNVFYEA
ncbi:unnamed protein product, partial [Heterotrigona itama]